jgi:long-chain acyl-CoA synthetase
MHLLHLVAQVEEPQINQTMDVFGIFSKNREEWAVVDLACMRSAVTIVPFFDSLGPQALSFVINQTELATMCCETNGIDSLLKLREKGDLKKLHSLVCYDKITEEQKSKAEQTGTKLYHYSDVIEEGRKHSTQMEFKKPTPDTIYIMCYTSGTTGDPKGSMMSHSYFVACAASVPYFQMNFTKDDISLSYLPYAHLFEQAFFCYTCFVGLKTGFY